MLVPVCHVARHLHSSWEQRWKDLNDADHEGREEEVDETMLSSRPADLVAVVEHSDRDAKLFLLVPLREKLPEAPLRPLRRNLHALAGVGQVSSVDHHRAEEVHRLLILMPLGGVVFVFDCQRLEVGDGVEVEAHVRAQDHADDLLPQRLPLPAAQPLQKVGFWASSEQLEELRDVEVLEHALVVVSERQVVLHVYMEAVRPAVVPEVVHNSGEDHPHYVHRVQEPADPDVHEQREQGLSDIRRMDVVVEGDLLRSSIEALHLVEEDTSPLRLHRKLGEATASAEGLVADELERAAVGRLGELEHVETP
mmetsp:Transcript_65488/g.188750  ORF Transcript_65488/g.188750 Transcript_65488/m.188750 type:complete len:309 (-) Transcript_65488:1572-2498(-)